MDTTYFKALFVIVFACHLALALEAPSPTCNGTDSYFKPTNRDVWVRYDKIHILSEPRDCPIFGNCTWRKKTHLSKWDQVHEIGVSKNYSCILLKNKATGWILNSSLCMTSDNRKSRNEPIVFSQMDYFRCERQRTIEGDKEFFTTEFKTDNGSIKTDFTPEGKIHYVLQLEQNDGNIKDEGLLSVKSSSPFEGAVLTNELVTLTMNDTDVTFEKTKNPALHKEFFYDPGGTLMTRAGGTGGNGCDLATLEVDKKKFIAFFFALKEAVAKGNRNLVASLIDYPLRWNAGKPVKIKSKDKFLKKYDSIVDTCVQQEVERQKLGEVFCNSNGITIGRGTIWVNQDEGRVLIDTINQRNCKR